MTAHHPLARKHTITATGAAGRKSNEPRVCGVKPDAGRDVRRPSSRPRALVAALQAQHTDAAVAAVSHIATRAEPATGRKNRKNGCVAPINLRQRIDASVEPSRDAQALGDAQRRFVIAPRTRYCAWQRWLGPLPRRPS
jgi:hypothetical protein